MAEKQFQIKVDITADQMQASARKVVKSLDEVNDATKKGAKQAQDASEKSLKFADSLKQMGYAARGAAMAIPGVGQVAALMANPLTAAIGAITGGIALFQSRTKALVDSMSGLLVPALKTQVGVVGTSEQAWAAYAEAVAKAASAQNDVAAANAKATKAIQDEYAAKRKVMEVDKQVELSRPGADKLEIERRYSQAGLAMSSEERARLVASEKAGAAALRASAEADLRASDAIKVGPKETDAAVLAQKSEMAAAARARRPEAIAELADLRTIAEATSPTKKSLAAYARVTNFGTKYGPADMSSQGFVEGLMRDRQLEISGIDAAIAGESSFARNLPERDAARARKLALAGGAGGKMGAADAADLRASEMEREFGTAGFLDQYQAKGADVTRLNAAISTKAAEVASAQSQLVAAQGKANAELLQAFQSGQRELAHLRAEVARALSEMDNMRNQK